MEVVKQVDDAQRGLPLVSLSPKARRLAEPYLLILPALLLLLVVVLYPATTAIRLSFEHYVLTEAGDRRFVGLANYIRALSDPYFALALKNSILWVGSNLILQLVLGLGVALVLNADFPLRGLVRGVILVPWVTPSVVAALMWRFLLDPSRGIVNDVLVRLGILDSPVPFISQPATAFGAIVLASVWFGVPFFAIMLLAGLQAIPEEIYHAATVDGATGFRSFWYITLPLLMPTILITTLLRTLWLSQYVDIIFLMTGGGPARTTTTLPVHAFLIARAQLDFGYASAIAVSLAVVLTLASGIYLVFLGRTGNSLR